MENKKFLILFTVIFVLCVNSSIFSQNLVDSFEYINAEESMARIDHFLIKLNEEPSATGYFILYGGKVNKKGEVEAHLNQIPKYLRLRRAENFPIEIVNGGFRERLSWEFWIVPAGEEVPEATPTVEKKATKIKGKFDKSAWLYACCDINL